MKINRESKTCNLIEQFGRQANIPWSPVLRPVSRGREMPLSLEDAWPGVKDARWPARLLASLDNTGHTRLRFRA